MTITPAPQAELLLEQPQTDEQAAFLIGAGDHAMRMGLKYFIGEKKLSVRKAHEQIIELNPDCKVTIHQLKRLATEMRKGEELEQVYEKRTIAQSCANPVENSPPQEAIDVEAVILERLPGETHCEYRKRIKQTTPSLLTDTHDNIRPQHTPPRPEQDHQGR